MAKVQRQDLMGTKTLWQLVLIVYFVALLPFFLAGMLVGFLGYTFRTGYFWGDRWADELFERAIGDDNAYIARVSRNGSV